MIRRLFAGAVLVTVAAAPALAGVVNPDISVIGQPFTRWTDDGSDPARRRATLGIGETEFFYDAYLNPYARGTFTVSLAEEGVELEEGFFQILRGLPAGLAIRGGKYRLGFGKFNPTHPHALPFGERPRLLADYLPRDESFNDVAAQVSGRIPVPGDFSLTAAADWLQGDAFRAAREPSGATNDPLALLGEEGDRASEPRPGALGRIALFAPIGDRSGVEVGVSGTRGTNNVAAGTRTTVYGGDVRAKLWSGAQSYLVLQGELLGMDREEAGWDSLAAVYTRTKVTPFGGFLFADWNFKTRWNLGAGYERWQQPTSDEVRDQVFRAFGGFSLMEETTAFRIDYERWQPGRPAGATSDPDAVQTVMMRVIFSMGPHKAHQF